MKKILVVSIAMLLVFSGFNTLVNADNAGRIKLKKNSQTIIVKLKNNGNKLSGVVSKNETMKLKNVLGGLWNSDKVGWNENSLARGRLVKKNKRRAIFRIKGTPNNDWGGWAFVSKKGKVVWLNIDMFKISGLSWEKKNNQIRYGNYEEPKIIFSSPGNATIEFKSNFLSGFNSEIKPEKVVGIFWNSDKVGWGENSQVGGKISKNNAGNYICEISGLPNTDKGSFTAKLNDGNLIWLNISKWEYSENIIVNNEEGLLEYILAP